MYIVIDENYHIYQTKVASGFLLRQAKEGKLSIVNVRGSPATSVRGFNRDGTWSDINKWDNKTRADFEAEQEIQMQL